MQRTPQCKHDKIDIQVVATIDNVRTNVDMYVPLVSYPSVISFTTSSPSRRRVARCRSMSPPPFPFPFPRTIEAHLNLSYPSFTPENSLFTCPKLDLFLTPDIYSCVLGSRKGLLRLLSSLHFKLESPRLPIHCLVLIPSFLRVDHTYSPPPTTISHTSTAPFFLSLPSPPLRALLKKWPKTPPSPYPPSSPSPKPSETPA